jgi:hypothetical protein
MHRALHRWVRETERVFDFARTAVVACSEASSCELGCYIHSFPQRLGRRTHLLPPFALCAALPRSDYYEGSAPHTRRHRTWRLAGLRGPGARVEVPVFQGGTRGALGGRLCPWLRGSSFAPELEDDVPTTDTPSRLMTGNRALATCSPLQTSSYPYRGFQHRLQHAWTFIHATSPWHLW